MFGYVDGYNDASNEIAPLLWCLGFAIENVAGKPIDCFLRGLFTDDELAPGGGDPGWVWYRDKNEGGSYIYHAWTNEDISGLVPCEADYDEATVKLHVRRTLDNFKKAHPDRTAEVQEVIQRYGL